MRPLPAHLALLGLLAVPMPSQAADGGVGAPAKLESGYLVTEDWRRPGMGSAQRLPDGGTLRRQRHGAECVVVQATTGPRPDRGSLRLLRMGGVADFIVTRTAEGWRLQSPTLRDPQTGFELVAICRQDLVVTDDAATPDVLETSAGTLFADRDACHAEASKGAERVCEGGVCGDAPGRAHLFDLGPCELALRQAWGTLGELRQASQAQRVASLNRLLEVFRKGGELYERRESATCVRWRVRPSGELTARLKAVVVTPAVRTTEEMELELFPLQQSASERDRSSSTQYDGGGIGMSGSSGGSRVPLLFGAGRFYLGGSWTFFSRAACARPDGR